MSDSTATAAASPNIAFIKYWGNRDAALRIPSNGSISMTLSGLETRTTVTLEPDLPQDTLSLDGEPAPPPALERTRNYLGMLRNVLGVSGNVSVSSSNNFPAGTGIASSASAFAALAAAYTRAHGITLNDKELSVLARLGSGSACRSILAGYVEWIADDISEHSCAVQIAPPDHWNLVDIIAIIGYAHKIVGSFTGHDLADSSPLQTARVAQAPERLAACRSAILARDFELLADTAEQDSNLMHAIMLTSNPCLLYWEPATILLMKEINRWRAQGLPVFYTIDAGPNVHCITPAEYTEQVGSRISGLPGIHELLTAEAGEGVRCV